MFNLLFSTCYYYYYYYCTVYIDTYYIINKWTLTRCFQFSSACRTEMTSSVLRFVNVQRTSDANQKPGSDDNFFFGYPRSAVAEPETSSCPRTSVAWDFSFGSRPILPPSSVTFRLSRQTRIISHAGFGETCIIWIVLTFSMFAAADLVAYYYIISSNLLLHTSVYYF